MAIIDVLATGDDAALMEAIRTAVLVLRYTVHRKSGDQVELVAKSCGEQVRLTRLLLIMVCIMADQHHMSSEEMNNLLDTFKIAIREES